MRLFILLILITFSFGADINKTLVDANSTYYKNLLQKIKDNNSTTLTINEALLHQIINLQKQKIHPFNLPKEIKTQDEYKKLSTKLFFLINKKVQISQNIKSLQKKIKTVKSEIAKEMPNSKNLLTLQLQYAFYKKGLLLYNKKLSIYNSTIKKITNLISTSLKDIYIDLSPLNEIKNIDKKLISINDSIQKYNIDIERLKLLNNQIAIKTISNEISLLNKKKQELIKDKLIDYFLLYSRALKQKDSKNVFNYQNTIKKILSNNYSNDISNEANKILNRLDKTFLGKIETIKGATLQEAKNVLALFWQEANAPLFNINNTPISAFKLTLALIVFIVSFFIGSFYKRKITNLDTSLKLSASSKTLIANLGYYIIVLISFFISLKILGVNLSSLAIVAGALSVGIGFGLQNIVSNFISGLILMFEKSIKIGDYIEFSESLRGRVLDISMRSTTITTNDNINVIVPNRELIENRVINWTMNDRIRRFKIPFGVAYGTDAHKVIKIVLDAVKNSGYGDIYHDKYRKTRVIMTGMGDSSLNFELFVWIKGEETLYPNRTMSRFLILIYDALNENGIEIPFPQQDLHIKSIDATIPLKLERGKFRE